MALVTGPTGSGKSMTLLRLGEVIDPNFSIRNVQFDLLGLMRLINGEYGELKRGAVILLDELGIAASARDWQKKSNKVFNFLLQTWRIKGFIFLAAVPSADFVDSNARKLFHSRMETLGIDYENKQVRIKPLLLQFSQGTGKLYNKYLIVRIKNKGKTKIKLMRVGLPSAELIKQYELKKQTFVDALNKSIQRDLEKEESKKIEEQIIKPERPLTDKQERVYKMIIEGMTVHQIAEELGRAAPSIYAHIKSLRKRGLKIPKGNLSNEHKNNFFSKKIEQII